MPMHSNKKKMKAKKTPAKKKKTKKTMKVSDRY